MTGGYFNVSLHAISDVHHRGDAYLGFLGTRLIDIATGDPFDAELPPRIASIAPKTGSLGGGTDMTIYGPASAPTRRSSTSRWAACRAT